MKDRKVLKIIIALETMIILVLTIILKMGEKKYLGMEKGNRKVISNYDTAYQWLYMKSMGYKMEVYLQNKGYQRIAVYGMGELGQLVLSDLKDTEIKVAYGIDINADDLFAAVPVKKPENELEPVDAILVSAVFAFDEIEKQMRDKVKCPVISLYDVVTGV